MLELGLTEETLARKAGVAEQTIRNYLSSCDTQPWNANSKAFRRVCDVLNSKTSELHMELEETTTPNHDEAILANQRFIAAPDTVRAIAGKWNAASEDLEIPGYLSYKSRIAWHGQLTIEQTGARFEAFGVDKDQDGVLVTGVLTEHGNYLKFEYYLENPKLRQYGTGMVEYKGDGKTLEGIFIGRDAGHSNIGLVVAKLTLTRADEAK